MARIYLICTHVQTGGENKGIVGYTCNDVFCTILQLFYRYPAKNNPNLAAFEYGRTGYPFIDAGMRQLRSEGWIHHFIRNATACFLTRGNKYRVPLLVSLRITNKNFAYRST